MMQLFQRKGSILKRTSGIILSMALITTMFTGCHGSVDRASFQVPEEFDESKNYEITFWAKNDTNKVQNEIYNKAIADFEKLYPNIKVNIKVYTDYNVIYNDVITNIATNTTPNVCVSYPDHVATYMTGENVVVPLDELISDRSYGLGGKKLKFEGPTKTEMVDKFLNECKINDVTYLLPYMRSTEATYINKDYVEKLGFTLPEVMTWDFIFEVAEAAMAQNEDGTFKLNNQKVMIPFIYKSTDNMMISYLKQAGAPYSTSLGEIGLFNDTTKELMYLCAEHGKTRAFSTFKISSYPGDYLNAGQSIFGIDSTAGSTWMGSKAPLLDIDESALVDFETEVMMIPQLDPEHPQMISQGPSICIFNKEDSGEVLASWLFAQFLLTNEVQINYSKTEGYIPVTEKALNSAEYKDYLSRAGENNDEYYDVKIKAAKLLLDNIDNTFVTPVFNGSTSLRNAAGQLVENSVKAVRRQQTVDEEFIEKQYADVTSLYRLDSISKGDGKQEFGALPKEAVVLFVCLGIAWAGIIVFFIAGKLKAMKKKR